MAITINRLKDYILTIPSGGVVVVRLAYNDDFNVEYVGYGAPGTENSEAAWRISKFFYSGTLMSGQRYADGDLLFNNVWDDRVSLTYS